MENNIKERHEIVSHLAEILHRWYCKEQHAENSDGDIGCTWMEESWEPLTGGGVRQDYFDKASKVYEFYDDPDECLKVLKFLKIVNPRLCDILIEEL